MKTIEITTGSFLIWKTRVESCIGEESIKLLVRVFELRLKENLVDVTLVGGIDNKIFTVNPLALHNISCIA